MIKLWNLGLSLMVLTAGATVWAKPFISEASGVCRAGGSLVIAGDETPDSFWVVGEKSQVPDVVEVEGGNWDDMEDLAAVDARRFFGTTSHGRTKKGKRKPEREQLLLIAKDESGFEVSRTWSLRNEILSALKSSLGNAVDIETAEEAIPDEGGLNVEGLAYHDGQLFIGLRSPLTKKGEALVLKITNGKALLNGAAPQFGEVARLPLKEKGVRGLTSDGTALVILAGSANDAAETFALFRWSPGAKAASAFSVTGFADLLRPEGLVVEKDGSFTFVQDFEDPGQQDVVVNLKAN